MLFDYAISWLRNKGMNWIEGPISPSDGDDYRALLSKGFDSPPVLFDSYNPKYYLDLFEAYGFEKYRDYYAFHFVADRFPTERFVKVVEYAKKKHADLILTITNRQPKVQNLFSASKIQYLIANKEKIPVLCVNPRKDLWSYGAYK